MHYNIDRESGYLLYKPDKWNAFLHVDNETLSTWLKRREITNDPVSFLSGADDWWISVSGDLSTSTHVNALLNFSVDGNSEEEGFSLRLTDEERLFIFEDMRELLEEDGVLDGHGGITGGLWL